MCFLLQILLEPEAVTLHHWLCIPDDVFGLMAKCMRVEAEERISLQDLGRELEHLLGQQQPDATEGSWEAGSSLSSASSGSSLSSASSGSSGSSDLPLLCLICLLWLL